MSDKKRHVFISYSREDNEKANDLIKELSGKNISLWTDQSIRAGDEWASEIERALDEASMYILLVSPKFAASNWVQYEVGHALARSKETGAPIVPIIIEDGPVPDYLNRFRWVDARGINSTEVAEKIQHILHSVENRT